MGLIRDIVLLMLGLLGLIILFFTLKYYVLSIICCILLIGSILQVFLELVIFKKITKVKIKDIKPRITHEEVSFGDKLKNTRNGILYDWDGLRESILKNGVLNPLKVKKSSDGYLVVDGHHRLRVLKELYDDNYEISVTVINKIK